VKDPRADDVIDYLEIKDKSVATSGDYEQYFTQGNKRYSHILDPKTGRPSESKVESSTVIADSGLTADALATAIFVLGKAEGEKLARKFYGVATKIF
jgi:thiamine biosynthesis lipoprotein